MHTILIVTSLSFLQSCFCFDVGYIRIYPYNISKQFFAKPYPWWNDERFSFLTTSLGKNLSSDVVKKENLSSLHVHRSNWEISTVQRCVWSLWWDELQSDQAYSQCSCLCNSWLVIGQMCASILMVCVYTSTHKVPYIECINFTVSVQTCIQTHTLTHVHTCDNNYN